MEGGGDDECCCDSEDAAEGGAEGDVERAGYDGCVGYEYLLKRNGVPLVSDMVGRGWGVYEPFGTSGATPGCT